MKDEVFEKCIADLSSIHYQNAISLYNNNEPFIDKRLIRFLQHTSPNLPHAKLFLFTNGDLLDQDTLKRSFDAGLQLLFISVYEKARLGHMRLFQKQFGKYRIRLLEQYRHAAVNHFHNYGGGIAHSQVCQHVPDNGCALPFKKLVVDARGNVGLCCVDFYNEIKFENVMRQSLVEIFTHHPALNNIRSILRTSRNGIPLCSRCSYPGHDYDVFASWSFWKRVKNRLAYGLALTKGGRK